MASGTLVQTIRSADIGTEEETIEVCPLETPVPVPSPEPLTEEPVSV